MENKMGRDAPEILPAPAQHKGLSAAVQEAINSTAQLLNVTELPGSEKLEVASAYFVLQELGVEMDDAAAIAPDVVTGGADDGGVDAIIVLVAGHNVRPEHGFERVIEILKDNPDASIDIICIQATGVIPGKKNDESIDSKLGKLISGTYAVLQNNPLGLNPHVSGWCNFIAGLFGALKEKYPDVVCNIVVRLVWPRQLGWQPLHTGRVAGLQKNIVLQGNDVGLTLKLDFEYLDEQAFTKVINVYQNTARGYLDARNLCKDGGECGADTEFYLGVVSARDYLGIVATQKGNEWKPKPHLFHDNIRAFLGSGKAVNKNIAETLSEPLGRAQFRNRNNGVTLVAEQAKLVDRGEGRQIELQNFSVVNGCQTSFMLAKCLPPTAHQALQETRVPVRIIISKDRDEIDKAIVALNSQTAVDPIQVFSRRQYVINLAVMFQVKNRGAKEKDRIFFERRTNEYGGTIRGKTNGIITLKELMYGYSSLFYGKTHEGTGQDNLIAAAEESKIFSNRHLEGFYYLTGLIILRARDEMDKKLRRRGALLHNYGGRNQIYAAIRLLSEKKLELKPPGARQGQYAQAYLDAMIAFLRNSKDSQAIAKKARDIVANGGMKNAKNVNNEPLSGSDGKKASNERFSGYVWNRVKTTSV